MSETKEAGMVERVAEALWQAESVRCMGKPRLVPWTETGDEQRKWRLMARAAVAAMHEPSEAMLAPFHQGAPSMVLVAKGIWQAMIDTALSEEPPHAQ